MTKLWHVYIRAGIAYIPVVAKTVAGFYLEIEPVAVVQVSDKPALIKTLENVGAEGIPAVPTPPRESFSKPVVMQRAEEKSWGKFARSTELWNISLDDLCYEVTGTKLEGTGWVPDPSRIFSISTELGLSGVADIIIGDKSLPS